jgi:DNA-binding response OmpR family regulator
MELVARVRRCLAVTIYWMRHSTPEVQAEVGQLRLRFLALAVALDVRRVSPEQGEPQLTEIEHQLWKLLATRPDSVTKLLLSQTQRVG